MISRFNFTVCILLSLLTGGHVHAAEPGSASIVGKWQMIGLACNGCSATGALPADLAGGEISIGADSFDDPLAGACPDPHFATGEPETMSVFLQHEAATALGPLQRLASPGAIVTPVDVVCKSPPHARNPTGASISLVLVSATTMIRPWTDGSYVILKRRETPPVRGASERHQ